MNLMGNLCSAKEHSVQFFVQVFYAVKLHSLTEVYGALYSLETGFVNFMREILG
jgi:hypothetical protein